MVWLAAPHVGVSGAGHAAAYFDAVEQHVYADLPPLALADAMSADATVTRAPSAAAHDATHIAMRLRTHSSDRDAWNACISLLSNGSDTSSVLVPVVLSLIQDASTPLPDVLDAVIALLCTHPDPTFWQRTGHAPLSVLSHLLAHPLLDKVPVTTLYKALSALLEALHTYSPAAYDEGLKTLMHDLLEKRQGAHIPVHVRTSYLVLGAQLLEQRVALAWDATLQHRSARACTQGDSSASFVLHVYASRIVSAVVRHPRLVRLIGLALAHDAVKTANVCVALSHTTTRVAQLRKRFMDHEAPDADESLYRAALAEHGTLSAPTTSPQLWTHVALLLGSDEARTAPMHLAAYLLRALTIVAPMYPAPVVEAHTPRALANEAAPAFVAFRTCITKAVIGTRQAMAMIVESLPPATAHLAAIAPRLRAVCLEAAPLLSICAAPALMQGIESLLQALSDPSYSRFEMLHTLWLEERAAALDGTQRFIALFLLATQHVSWTWPLARAGVRLIDDLLHVLCDRTVGVLLPYIPWGTLADGPRVLALWTGLAQCVATIFAQVPGWSRTGDRQAMLPYLAHVPALASYMVQSADLASRATELEGLEDGVQTALLAPLHEAVAWLRLNHGELLQQLFDYLRRTVKVLKAHGVCVPPAFQTQVIDFLTQQLAIPDAQERRTLLTTPQMELLLEECRALRTEAPAGPSAPRPSPPLRQQTLPWAPARPARAPPAPTPVVDLTREAPSPSAFRKATHTPAAATRSAPRVRSSTGKLAQLRNEFQLTRTAARRPHAPRREFEPDEPRAPLAMSSVTGAIRPPPVRPAPPPESDTTSESESEDEGGRRGLSSLASPPKAKAPVVRRRVQPMTDPALQETMRRAEDEQRRRRLRTPPSMAPLHEGLTRWDMGSQALTPPCRLDGLPFPASIPSWAPNADAYMERFGTLLSLEAWAQFQQSCEQRKEVPSVDVHYVRQRRVDSFVQLELITTGTVPTGFGLSDTDVVCLELPERAFEAVAVVCRARASATDARVLDLELRCAHAKVQSALPYVSERGWRLRKLLTLTTLRREYAALGSVPDLLLAQDLLQARVAPRPEVSDADRARAAHTYALNAPQAQAVVAAMRTNGFSLIQGPPGTGKTKTIRALVASHLVRQRPARSAKRTPDAKILLCAPSNAAIDELVARLKDGVDVDGERIVPRLVRLGREDAVHPSVQDVTLDALARGTETGRPIGDVQAEQRRVEAQVQAARQQLAAGITGAQARERQRELNELSDRLLELREELQSLESRQRRSLQRTDAGLSLTRKQVLDDAEVVCATLASAGHESLYAYTFDTVVIDEAAQAVELSALIPLRYECRRCILVGDPKQLPPTVISTEAERRGYAQSLFVRLYEAASDRVHLLSIQYRMHPSISQFPSAAFYGRHLRDGPGMAEATAQPWHAAPLFGPFRFLDVRGTESMGRGHSLQNTAEARAAMQAYEALQQVAGQSLAGRVAFISMYKAQVELLRSLFVQRYGRASADHADFRSVDGFQGQEKDIIFLSCVRSNSDGTMGFLGDQRRLNVALTRARSNLIVLGHASHLCHDPVWRRLITEARTLQCCIEVTPHTFTNPAKMARPKAVLGPEPVPQDPAPAPPQSPAAPAPKQTMQPAPKRPRVETTVSPKVAPSESLHKQTPALKVPPKVAPSESLRKQTPALKAPPKVAPSASLRKQTPTPKAPPKVVPSASLLKRPTVPKVRPRTASEAETPPTVGRAQPTWLRSARPPILPKKP